MNNNYNMLIITDYSAPYEGNFIESIKSLNKKYDELGNKIIYIFPERTKKLKWINKIISENNFKIYFFKDDSITSIIKTLKYTIKENNINIIYTHFCRHKTQLAVKIIRNLNKKIRLISHFHNHCKVNGNFFKRLFMKFAYKLYEGDLNIGCSESVKKSMPYKENKTTYVNNGISFSRLDNTEITKLNEYDKNKFIILMFGFDYYRKGVDITIKALKELNNPNIMLAISIATNKERIKNIIKKEFAEIPDFITFLEPTNNIASYYKASDLFLSAAREEGFCYSIVEAAYCKTKILSSNIPGVPKEIPGEYIFENNNPVDLSRKIDEIYNDKLDHTEKAYEYVKKEYDVSKWTEIIANKIDSFMKEKNEEDNVHLYPRNCLLK